MPDAYDVRVGDRPYVFNPEWDLMNDYRTRSMLSLPIRDGRGDVVGVLQLINARDEAGPLAPVFAARRDPAGGLPRGRSDPGRDGVTRPQRCASAGGRPPRRS